LQAEPYDQASAFWVQVCAAVADCFGIKCGLIPWLADEVKWEAITIEQGRLLSTLDHESPAPFSYWDFNRATLGLGMETIYTSVRTVARFGGDSTRYMYCVTEFRI
jgi:hypothetical protein